MKIRFLLLSLRNLLLVFTCLIFYSNAIISIYHQLRGEVNSVLNSFTHKVPLCEAVVPIEGIGQKHAPTDCILSPWYPRKELLVLLVQEESVFVNRAES